MATADAAWGRRYAEAAAQVRRAVEGGDFRAAAELGRYAAAAAPDGAEGWALAAAAAGDGHAAAALLDAHLAGGGAVTLLARPRGDGRLLEAVEALVRAGWGADAAADGAAAGRLAGLFLRLDPTDSYLYAARWERVAEAAGPAGGAEGGGGRDGRAGGRVGAAVAAGPAAAAVLVGVWRDWFGWTVEADGSASAVVPAEGRPSRRCALTGIPSRSLGRADLEVDGPVVRVRAAGREVAGGVGERLAL